jgi:hypothetical protein
MKVMTRKRQRREKMEKKKFYKKRRVRRILERSGTQTAAPPTTKDSSPLPSTSHHSSPTKNLVVYPRSMPKYISSSDEESSGDEEDYSMLFKGLDSFKVDKINELIDSLNEKDRLLEKQDLIYVEYYKFVSVEKALALELEKNKNLTKEFDDCHSFISYLKIANEELNDISEVE